MKLLTRLSTLILAGIFPVSLACAQNAPPDGPPGQGSSGGQMMATLAEHGVQGTVTSITGANLIVKTEDGASYKIETGANTHFRKQRDQIAITDIHVGDMVGAFGDKDEKAKTLGAIAVMVFDKEQFEKARADFGKTWTAGTIQSIDETKITVKRPDNVVQIIVVDENTSFHKRRDSITLADIKVGDNVNARGALQGGNFLATMLNVGGPGGPGGGFRGGPRPNGAPSGQDAPLPPPANPSSPNQ